MGIPLVAGANDVGRLWTLVQLTVEFQNGGQEHEDGNTRWLCGIQYDSIL